MDIYRLLYIFAAYYMENFGAHGSDEKPQRPVIPAFSYEENYPRCAQYGGSPPEGYDVQLKCEEKVEGRYVYVHTSKKFPLTLCEVQIFGSPVSNDKPGNVFHNVIQTLSYHGRCVALCKKKSTEFGTVAPQNHMLTAALISGCRLFWKK